MILDLSLPSLDDVHLFTYVSLRRFVRRSLYVSLGKFQVYGAQHVHDGPFFFDDIRVSFQIPVCF